MFIGFVGHQDKVKGSMFWVLLGCRIYGSGRLVEYWISAPMGHQTEMVSGSIASPELGSLDLKVSRVRKWSRGSSACRISIRKEIIFVAKFTLTMSIKAF